MKWWVHEKFLIVRSQLGHALFFFFLKAHVDPWFKRKLNAFKKMIFLHKNALVAFGKAN